MSKRLVVLALAIAVCGSGAVGGSDGAVAAGSPVAGCAAATSLAPARMTVGKAQLILSGQTSSLWRHKESGYNMYVRFYADGTVIGVSSSGTPAQIRPWFKAPYDDTGRYVVNGASLRFTLTSPAGRVDYDGVISGAALRLHSCSHINNKQFNDIYARVTER